MKWYGTTNKPQRLVGVDWVPMAWAYWGATPLPERALYNAIANALTDHPRVTINTARKIARITSDINGYCVCDTFIRLRD